MVYLHGGSFSYGETNLYMPDHLLDHEVILVTVAYRLGALGKKSNPNSDNDNIY